MRVQSAHPGRGQVACLGILVADVVAKPVSALPRKGQLTLVDHISVHTGGCATNTAIDLATIGECAAVVGLVGDDALGDYLAKELESHRVDTRALRRTTRAATSTSVVLSDTDGERSFLHDTGANAIITENDLDWAVIEKSEILFVAGALLMPSLDGEPTARVLRRAREAGVYTALDTAWDSTGRWIDAIGPCLAHLDLFIPSYEEAAMLSW